MANKTIAQLPAATAAADTDEFEVSQAGISRKVTRAQLLAGIPLPSHTHTASQISDATAVGRTLLTAANAAAQRTALAINNLDDTSDANKPVSTAQQTALDGKANTSHTHNASTITDFSEAVDDRVSNLLVAGSNINLAYDDAGNVLTISLGNSPSVSGGFSDSKGNVRDLPANNRGAAYTAAIGDTGRVISISAGGVTIPSAVFSEGQAVSIYNRSNSSQTITQGSGLTMYQAGTTNTGNRTLAPRGFATIWFEAGNICVISGNIA